VHIAYFLIVHKLPEQVVRLVRRLDAPGVTFYVHVDATSPEGVFEAIRLGVASMPNVRFVRRHSCYWAGLGSVLGTLDCMRAALAEVPQVDYAFLLSGQDYPLRRHADVVSAIETAGGRTHMAWMQLPTSSWSGGGLYRYQVWHVRIGDRTIRLPRNPHALTRTGRGWSRLLHRLGVLRRFPRGMAPFGGSAFWGMSRDSMAYVTGFSDANPSFTEYFRHVFCPDEMFFQTILMNSPLRSSVVGNDLRYIRWDPATSYAHPVTLTTADLPDMMASGALFARKFDPAVDSELLDLIDRHLDGPARPTVT
jgi:hypothetical protein